MDLVERRIHLCFAGFGRMDGSAKVEADGAGNHQSGVA
jgi:hypothetical protein